MYSHEYCDELEKGWLTFSDLLIHSNNYRDAEEVLQKCLKYNFNCGKAEEYLGMIYEKNKELENASMHYQKAWDLNRGKAPTVGYRLASIHLKTKNFVQCIEVCKKVLETYPDFAKIEKEVYSKARGSLRP
mmetsp:Transcript_23389/g.20332  ORF Transcript_23389/g.20332 Transcript_23389/m.20332 type:complete len:131 (+) Transcript_23389:1500-1892(+)